MRRRLAVARESDRSFLNRLPWLEAVGAFILGLLLYYPFKSTDLGVLTWVVGGLLTLSRFAYEARLERELGPVRRLAEIVDLSQGSDIGELRNLLDTYFRIHESEFRSVKNQIVADARDRLLQLANDKTSDPLPPGEYYGWLLGMVDGAAAGSTIRALSLMRPSEWDDSPTERRFLEFMLAAARRGVEIQRVFVMPPTDLPSALRIPAVRFHAKGEEPSGLRGYFVDRDYLRNRDPKLEAKLGDGFIAFDRKVALVDLFEDGQARGKVTMHPAEISRLCDLHDQLIYHSEEMSLSQGKQVP